MLSSINKKNYPVFIALMFLLCFQNIKAQNINAPNKTGPMGVQVNTRTGNLFLNRTDIYIPARQLDFDISFAYNSYNYTENTGYGNGWSFRYNMRYKFDTAGRTIIVWGDGREDTYKNNGGQLTPPAGFFDSLSQYQTGKYLLRTKGGLKFYFDNNTHKRLTKVQEPNGNFLNFNYTDTLITSITNAAGQTITLSYSAGKLSSVIDANASPVQTYIYTYDSYGNLIKVTDPAGGTYKYSYLVNGPMASISDKNNNVADLIYYSDFSAREIVTCNSRTAFSYDTATRTTTVIDFVPTGTNQVSTYIYNEKGWLSKLIGNCCGYNMTFTYDNSGNLTERKDANGNIYKYTYDNKGNYLTITDALNHVTAYTYSSDFNMITSITDPLGNIYSVNYSSAGNPTQITRPGNLQKVLTYSANGDLLTAKDEKNNTINFLYDAYGYPQKITFPLNTEVQSIFDARGNILSAKDANANTYLYQYDSLNRITKFTKPLGLVENFDYDKEGNLTTFTDPKGFKHQLFYDASNRMVSYKDPKGGVISLNYDARNNLIQYTDQRGKASTFKYDNQNHLTSIIDAVGNGYSFNYDAVGNTITAVNPLGNSVNYIYDKLNRVVSSSDETGSLGSVTYDNNGRLSSYTNASGAAVSFAYDNLNRLTKITDPLGNTRVYTYDNNDNLLTQKDRNNHTSSYTYDALDRVTSFTNNNGNVINVQYDAIGNVTKLIDQNGNITSYEYDAANRAVKMIYANGSNIFVTYDNNDNITSSKLANGTTINYSYDSTNMMISSDLPGGEHYQFTYDAKHRLIGASNAAGMITFAYDDIDRITSEMFSSHLTSYNYNLASRTVTTTYPNGTLVSKNFDKRGRLSQMSLNNQQLTNYQYNNIGQLTQKNYSNGVITNYFYDNANRLTSISSNKNYLPSISFQYDNERNKTSVIRVNDPQYSETFAYDANNRLINYKQGAISGNNIANPLIQNNYTYDAVGNRISANLNGVITNYTVNNLNQYTTAGGVNFSYDGNGNQTYNGNFYMRYDAFGRKLVDSVAGNIFRYVYDALGRRVVKSVNGIPSNYYYSGLKQIEERNASDGLVATQVFQSFQTVLEKNYNNQKYFFHQNHLNSTEAVTDSAGNSIERYKYEDFGKTYILNAQNNPIAVSAINNRFLYTGQEYDAHNGSYKFHFRNYMTTTGSFTQRDPIGYGDEMGMYQYVGNNPGTYTDPLGLAPCPPSEPRTLDQVETYSSWVNGLGSWADILTKSDKLRKEIETLGKFEHDLEVMANVLHDQKMYKQAEKLAETMVNTSDKLQVLKNSRLGKLANGLGKLGTGLNLLDWGIKSYKFGEAISNYRNGTGDGYQLTKAGGNMAQSGLGFTPIGAAYNLFDFTQEKLTSLATGGNGQSMNDNAEYAGQFYGDMEYNAELSFKKWTGWGDQSEDAVKSENSLKWEMAKRKMLEKERIRRLNQQNNQGNDCPPNDNNNGTQKPPIKNLNDLIKFLTELIFNHDPNEMIGPVGVGTNKWVSVKDRLPYSILFENDTSATAPVKVVKVIYPIDPKQDANTFQLGGFGFNNLTFTIPGNVNSYSQRLDVRDSLGLFVDVTAGIDGVNHQAFWIFESIDPVTLLPTNNPLKGFLLTHNPNNPSAGNGFVNFSIKPIATARTRDTISAIASIVFDANDTILTNRAKNTIDALPPTSQMNQMIEPIAPGIVKISWTGTDDAGGCGVKSYSLYMSVNSKPYSLYRANISETFIYFTGSKDTVYCFFVAAKDSVNNVEALKNQCELRVILSSGPLPVTWLDFTGSRRVDDALLLWSTTNEINTRSYVVERSLNGTTFTAIGNVIATGNRSGINNYNFTDVGIVNTGVSIIYYRIKQVDIDGRFTYSRTIAIRVDNPTNAPLISVFPNPFDQYITLKVTPVSAQDKTNSVELYSLQGALLYKKEINKPGTAIILLNDLPNLSSGMYILKTVVNGIPYTNKMFKN